MLLFFLFQLHLPNTNSITTDYLYYRNSTTACKFPFPQGRKIRELLALLTTDLISPKEP
uniref:Uncharacterized protein n=1 Tax=Arundo donax TaxID=35708 RepID=A0A0A9E3J6_ARUDO